MIGVRIQAYVFLEGHLMNVFVKYFKIVASTDLEDYFDSDFKDKRDQFKSLFALIESNHKSETWVHL